MRDSLDAFMLLRRRARGYHGQRADVPPKRVRLVSPPCVGHCLVMFTEDGVVHTTPVCRWVATADRVAIETENSCYVLALVDESDDPPHEER